MRARIGKYACEHGVATATRHCSRELEKPLNESTVRGLKNAYLMEVGLKRRAREADLTVDKLNPAKRGHRLLLGEQIDEQVKHYLHKLRDCGGIVNTAIAIAGATESYKTHLSQYCGHLNLSTSWAKSLLARMGFVKRRATTKISHVTVENFPGIKRKFLSDVQTVVQLENIPPELIFNWDQTGI